MQPAALALGTHVSLARSLALSDERRVQLQDESRLAHQPGALASTSGYPYGAGYYTAVYCNGIPVIVPSTSLSLIYSQAPGYIDPLDPGTCTKPNIAATRGIHEPNLAGGFLTTPRVDADLTVEYRPPTRGVLAQSVFGLQVQNLFNQLYNVPIVNGCYGAPVTQRPAERNAPCTYSTAPYAPPDVAAHSGVAVSDLSERAADLVPPLLSGDDMKIFLGIAFVGRVCCCSLRAGTAARRSRR